MSRMTKMMGTPLSSVRSWCVFEDEKSGVSAGSRKGLTPDQWDLGHFSYDGVMYLTKLVVENPAEEKVPHAPPPIPVSADLPNPRLHITLGAPRNTCTTLLFPTKKPLVQRIKLDDPQHQARAPRVSP